MTGDEARDIIGRLISDPASFGSLSSKRAFELLPYVSALLLGVTARIAAPESQADSEMLNPGEAARYLRMSPQFVYEHRAELGGIKAGRCVRFQKGALRRWMAECAEATPRRNGARTAGRP